MDKRYILLALLLLALFAASFLVYKSRDLERTFRKSAQAGLTRDAALPKSILTEDDMKHLPAPVQKYLTYVGAVGKEKVHNVRAVVEGEMKLDPSKGWVKIKAEQYNFFDSELTRLFYMKAKMNGLPVYGLHSYTDEKAGMLIKAAGLITVLDAHGPEMRISDTTTLFNDMCFFAPATLIDKRIQWETIDALTVKATFENNGCKVSAMLYFNDKGEMIDFVSDDRYYMPMDGSCRKARWSTPMSSYKERDGIRLPSYGEAVWKLPEGDLCYAKFTDIKEVKYNCDSLK